ncbi:MAG: TIM barrel protein, partial [Nanoarchaeota archaeon]|nr:TIM barrel protein [Nanoarchaeota archaeon]
TKEKAPLVFEAQKKNDVLLTCHGQYYINLSSLEKEKIKASKERVLNAARIAHKCGAYSMTFHAGFYQGRTPDVVYDQIKKALVEISKKLKDEGNNIWIRPETTGKASQWGDLKEIVKISKEVSHVLPCIDFAHLHARTQKNNTLSEFREILSFVEKELGRKCLDNMHIHMSGIAYSAKGEKHHLELEHSDLNYKDLMKVWKEFRIKGAVINESPNVEKDALLMQEYWKHINKR